MPHVSLTWIAEQRFLGVDSGNHSIILSAPHDVGVKPAETLLIALAACASYDIVAIIAKRRAVLQRLVVYIHAKQAEKPPRAFIAIDLRFEVTADNLSEVQLQRIVDLALNRYCTVRASLSPSINVTFEAVLLGE